MFDNPEVVKDILDRLKTVSLNPLKYSTRWYENPENRARRKAYVKDWQEKHPARHKLHVLKSRSKPRAKELASIRRDRRRALQLGCEGSHSIKEWLDKKAQYGYCCAYCHRKLRRLTKDHIIPLSKGGTNFIHNIVPACRHCNSSKRDHDILQWEKFSALQLPLSTG